MLGLGQIVFRLFLATLLGGLIGFEREAHGRAAGLRTHILVSTASCLLMLTSLFIFEIYKGSAPIDPTRIASQVITGMGFLGAGTIIRFRASVRGLTTAASLWSVAGIGLAVGSGFYDGAYLATVFILVALFFLTKLERKLVRRDWYKTLIVETKSQPEQLQSIRSALSEYEIEVKDLQIAKSEVMGNVILHLNLKLTATNLDDRIISDIMQIDGVKRAKWE